MCFALLILNRNVIFLDQKVLVYITTVDTQRISSVSGVCCSSSVRQSCLRLAGTAAAADRAFSSVSGGCLPFPRPSGWQWSSVQEIRPKRLLLQNQEQKDRKSSSVKFDLDGEGQSRSFDVKVKSRSSSFKWISTKVVFFFWLKDTDLNNIVSSIYIIGTYSSLLLNIIIIYLIYIKWIQLCIVQKRITCGISKTNIMYSFDNSSTQGQNDMLLITLYTRMTYKKFMCKCCLFIIVVFLPVGRKIITFVTSYKTIEV